MEGIPFSLGNSPLNIVSWATNQGVNGHYDGFETAYSIKRASERGINFCGGEPESSFLMEKILESGYTQEDYYFYCLTQQVFQAIEGEYFISLAKSFDNFLEQMNIQDLEQEDYLLWFEKYFGKSFSPEIITPDVCAPYATGDLITQKISSQQCIIRDQFILSVIEKELLINDRVLVVYGGSHWSTQKLVLESALSKPSFTL